MGSRADELKAMLLRIVELTDVGLIIFQTSNPIYNRLAFDKAPEVRVETSVFLLVLQN